MFTILFWTLTLERALKTAAEGALIYIGAERLSAWDWDWVGLAGYALAGFVLSLLFSVGSIAVGTKGIPSLVKVPE
jgi:hypothetical protein